MVKDTSGDLLRVSSLLKRPAFAEEDEWRVVSPLLDSNPVAPSIEYREGTSMLIPSLGFELPQSDDRQVELEHVCLGPTHHVELSMMSLNSFLAEAGAAPRQGTTYCDIPLRDC